MAGVYLGIDANDSWNVRTELNTRKRIRVLYIIFRIVIRET